MKYNEWIIYNAIVDVLSGNTQINTNTLANIFATFCKNDCGDYNNHEAYISMNI